MPIITPKNAVEIVLATKTQNASFRPYETSIQKWLFWLAIGSLSAGSILALVTYAWENSYVNFGALFLVAISSLLAVAYQIASLVPELIKLRNIEREIATPFLAEFNNDLDLIHELTQTCELHHLQYAKKNFQMMSHQLRERIGILVGALEKVGLIPVATTAYFAFLKAQKEGISPFGGIEWVLVAFVLLYIFAARMNGTAQWMEKVAGIYDQAIALKSKHMTGDSLTRFPENAS